jgi:hypothetical protein
MEDDMDMKNGPLGDGLARLKGLLAWWGIPDSAATFVIDRKIQGLQCFAFDLQKVLTEASNSSVDILFATSRRVSRSLEELLRSTQPEKLLTVHSEIMAALLEGGSSQAKTWVELTQKVQEQYGALVGKTLENSAKQRADNQHHVAPTSGEPSDKVNLERKHEASKRTHAR